MRQNPSDQVEHSVRFATPQSDKFAGMAWQQSEEGVPLLDDVTMQLVCENHQRIEAGDHIIFLARVLRYEIRPSDPLIFCRGAYLGGVTAAGTGARAC